MLINTKINETKHQEIQTERPDYKVWCKEQYSHIQLSACIQHQKEEKQNDCFWCGYFEKG